MSRASYFTINHTKWMQNLKGLDFLKELFLTFAESECKGNSPLYYRLSIQIANDNDFLNIAASTREGQPVPNIFLGAVHYLLLKNQDEHLANYYPSIQQKFIAEIPFKLFKGFCLDHEDEIRKIISTRIVQTHPICCTLPFYSFNRFSMSILWCKTLITSISTLSICR